jgi:putative hydrolase of the HAD superfamily
MTVPIPVVHNTVVPGSNTGTVVPGSSTGTVVPGSSTGIEAILFDMNGTLRTREPHEPTRRAATLRILEMLGKADASDSFWEEAPRRFKAYGQWAQENLLQLSEIEIWTRWILPDVPREKIEPIAAELTLAWSERKGRMIPKPGAEKTLVELKQRGYRLGVISNSMSSLDIPRSLDAYGWKELFEIVVLSSAVKCRKPAPEPFLEAVRAMNVEPERCAYLGNRISKDIVGCKRAGFALGIILEPSGGPRLDEQDQIIQPEMVIHSLSELLDIFPGRVPPGTKVITN